MAVSTRCSTDHHGAMIAPPGVDLATASPAEVDDAIRELLLVQQDHWLSIRTDGELRRRPGAPVDLVAEARFLVAETDGFIKIRVPRRPDGAIADTAVLAELMGLGVRYLELDGSAYAPLTHTASRAEIAAGGTDPDAVLAEMLDRDAAVLAPLVVPADVKVAVCMHDPAGDPGPAFSTDLDEASARKVFESLPANRYLFDCVEAPTEYGFLTLLPEGTEIALCLLDNARGNVTDPEELLAQLLAAAEVVHEDRLALGIRLGFRVAPGQDQAEAFAHMRDVFTAHLDAATRAWGIDF